MSRLALTLLGLFAVAAVAAEPKYVRKATRTETLVATLKASGYPTLEAGWQIIGPFDNGGGGGLEKPYPPEQELKLDAVYRGKDNKEVRWKKFDSFKLGQILNLNVFGTSGNDSVCYLYQTFESDGTFDWPLSLGSDDGIAVFFNGKQVLMSDASRPAAPDQEHVTLKVQKGRNELLLKVSNHGGGWEVYVLPELPSTLKAFVPRYNRDFPSPGSAKNPGGGVAATEAKFYRIETIPVPESIILEVGGLGFRPDGKLLACTRRGDVYLIDGLNGDLAQVKLTKFATGLHEALGLFVEDNKTVYVVQRPELTKLVDTDGDGVADQYVTVCDKWGVSGDYHEFAFGPARDKDGNFFVTLNVGFGGGHQSKSPWRGWCVKISPKGELTPWATGLRSPNGVNFSPEGDLFYCDNQGEWVATNKMHHIKEGEFYGHQAGLRYVKESQFAKSLTEKVPSGMLYDGQKGKGGQTGMPQLSPPCIWFPYGKMGQSASEPRWDTTGGKFGPFAGQCLVGDQTKSCVMRVDLEKINGKYQGACFPFKSGFQCGINRLVFGPDNALYVGQTNRGWGSVGPKSQGLQRLVFTGEIPLEVLTMRLTKAGFVMTFTKPVDPAKLTDKSFSVQSYTYNYFSTYGSPEEDRRAEKFEVAKVAPDGKSVTLSVAGLRQGRVYEVTLNGVTAPDGESMLHNEMWYTLNELP